MKKLDFEKGGGLIPAIVQDEQSRKVLMLGYMNEDAYRITLKTGLVTFYSRTRKVLWTKGASSGNSMEVRKILIDCDQDTLLIMARPSGPVCHDGPDTCFNEINDGGYSFLEYLQALVKERKREAPEGSYTSGLFKKGTAGIAQKVGEEAVELVIEAMRHNDEAFLHESADLIYHLMVLLVDKGWEMKDVVRVLEKRHQ